MKATITIHDEVNVNVSGLETQDINALYDKFGVYAKGYRHQVKYKLGRWDGKIHHFHKSGKTFVKLLPEIVQYLQNRDYGFDIKDYRVSKDLTVPPIDENYLKNKGYDVILGDHQVRGVNALIRNSGGIFEGGTGAGKAQPLSSKILTKNGWVTMGEIKVGDTVIDPVTGNSVNVSGIYPQGKKDIYEITFHDGSKTRTCKEHLWLAKVPVNYGKTRREEKIISTQDMIDFLERKELGHYTPRNISIQTTVPISYSKKSLAIDPYLLGLLLGDGFLSGTPSFSSSDEFLVEEVRKRVNDLELEVKYAGQYDYYISKKTEKKNQHKKNNLSEKLKALNLWGTRSHTKFIPEVYKKSSIEDRMELIRGLMDTDGTVDKKGSTSYCTSNLRLAKDFQEVCWSLGMVCTIKEKPTKHKLSYTITVGCESPISLFNLPRKRERCKEKWNGNRSGIDRRVLDVKLVSNEKAQCIMVDSDDHLYITDDYIVTHNTLMTAVLAHLYEETHKFKCMVIVPTSDLIRQTHKEMEMFGVDVGMYGDGIKDVSRQHLVSTWQSLQHNPGLIGQFHVVLVDECHGVTGETLRDILNNHGAKCLIRMGLTGTLPEEPIDQMAVRITLGNVVEKVEASELMASGWLAELKLYMYELNEDVREEFAAFCVDHPDKAADVTYKQYKNTYAFPDYTSEKKHLQKKQERLEFLAKIISVSKKNTMVLVPNVDFGRKISKLIPNAMFFYGNDSKKVRDEIYASFDEGTDIIAITTYSLASTGLNIKRIFNLYLIDAGKSYVKVIQSIGRGLRKAHDKDKVMVYDIFSDLKFSKRHSNARKKHYAKKTYKYKYKKVDYTQLLE